MSSELTTVADTSMTLGKHLTKKIQSYLILVNFQVLESVAIDLWHKYLGPKNSYELQLISVLLLFSNPVLF